MPEPTDADYVKAQAIVDKYVLATPAERLGATAFPNDIAKAIAGERERIVAYLRKQGADYGLSKSTGIPALVCGKLADAIERGENL